MWYNDKTIAGVMELADVTDSKSVGSNTVWVRVPPPAPNSTNPNPKPVGEGFGFVVYFDYPNFNSKQGKQKMKNGGQENESEHR